MSAVFLASQFKQNGTGGLRSGFSGVASGLYLLGFCNKQRSKFMPTLREPLGFKPRLWTGGHRTNCAVPVSSKYLLRGNRVIDWGRVLWAASVEQPSAAYDCCTTFIGKSISERHVK